MDAKDTTAAAKTAAPAGLEGVVAATSSVGDVDGINGILIYQGYNIHDLAAHSTFEETVWLIWHGRLPTRAELDEFKRQLAANYEIPTEVKQMIEQFPKSADPMDSLRT